MAQEEVLERIPGAAPVPAPYRHRWWVLVATCLGLSMLYIDLFIVNVALPAISRDFQTDLGTVAWTVSGYALMVAVLPMGMGRLADLWGQRKMYLAGLAFFTLASVLCGLAPNIFVLVVCRVLQGIGAGVMTPGTLAIVVRAFPPEQRGFVIGLNGGVSGLGLVAGPFLGGLLTQLDNWRLIFYINLPFGLLALALTWFFVRETRDDQAKKLDWPGLLTLSFGLLFIMFALTEFKPDNWLSFEVLGSFLVGVGLLVFFIAIEKRAPYPLIELGMFANPAFGMASLTFLLFSAALFGSQPYWSLFMQNFWGLSPLEGGLAFLPATGLIAILTPFAGIIGQRVGNKLRFIIIGGVVLMGLSYLYVAQLQAGSDYFSGLLPAFLGRGLGIPLFSACVTLAVMSALPVSKAGLAAGTLSMARNIGTALGIALQGGIYTFYIAHNLPERLNGVSGVEVTRLTQAASQFVVSGQGSTQSIVRGTILDGFVVVAWACLALCAVTVVTASFIRKRA